MVFGAATLIRALAVLVEAVVSCVTMASFTGSSAPARSLMIGAASVNITNNLGLPAHSLARRKENRPKTFPNSRALLVALRSADDTNLAFCTLQGKHRTYHNFLPSPHLEARAIDNCLHDKGGDEVWSAVPILAQGCPNGRGRRLEFNGGADTLGGVARLAQW